MTKENRPGARAALGEADQEKISSRESTNRPTGNTSTAYVCVAEYLIGLIDRGPY